MATPNVSPYNTNGKVKTGRTAMNGDYVSASVLAKANNYELCAGWACYTGLKYFEIKPILTWAEYPTGIIDIPLDSSGNPTVDADANIYNSYINGWIASQGILNPHAAIHAPELRYFCSLYSSTTRKIVWMSSGSGYDTTTVYFEPDTLTTYTPAKSFDLSANFTLNLDVFCKERVEIVQSVGAGGEWSWPDGCFEDGMGTTKATFDAIGDTSVCSLIVGGDTIPSDDMPDNFISTPAYNPFTSERTIEGKAGLYTSQPAWFGWGQNQASQYTMTNQAVFEELTQVAKMTLGVREMDLRFRAGQTYTGTDTNCEGTATDNVFDYKAKNSPASTSGISVCTHAKWTNLGISYKHDVDFEMMDGENDGATPEFVDIASNTTWSGTLSPLIVYDGVWQLKMYELDGSIMDTRSTETDASGSGASWARSNAAPSYLQVRFTNPEDYNDTAESQYNEQTEQWEDRDDYRCQFVFPREREVVSWLLDDSTAIDGLDTIGTAGVGGWNAVNCTLGLDGSGNLTISNASSGAYIYRKDFMTDADITLPKHWPGHRFVRIYADCFDSVSDPIDYALKLTVKRSGNADSMSKVFAVQVYAHPGGTPPAGLSADSWIARYDICHPEDAAGIDTTESYIETALPLDTIINSLDERENAELSNLSWSWGIGAFDRIEISGFTAGNTYTLYDLSTIYLDPTSGTEDRTHYGKVTYIQQECNKWRDVGATAITEYPEDDWDNEVFRHIIAVVNGRYAWEAPSVKVSKSPHYVVDLYSNYSLEDVFISSNNRWPLDDFSAYAFTVAAAFDSGNWDSTEEEYTTEDVLFNRDTCPIWFCKTKSIAQGEHDNVHTGSIYASPMYDRVTLYPSYGDGTGTTARTGYATLKLIKRVRGRVNGIAYHAGVLPYDEANPDSLDAYYSVREDSSSGEESKSDGWGYFRTGDIDNPQNIWIGSGHNLVTFNPVKNRIWNRLVFDVSFGGWLRYNPATGELIHTVYPDPGSLAACTQPSE